VEFVEYIAARVFALCMRVLPLRCASAAGGLVGRLGWALDSRHADRAVEQIAACFPLKTAPERRRIAKASFVHLGRCAGEFAHLTRLNSATVARFIDMQGLDRLQELLARGRGAIFITGHIGFWELTGGSLAASGIALTVIARPIDNPRVNAFVRRVRSASGQIVVDKLGAMRGSLRAIKSGGALGILMDQDAGKTGLFVDFLGRPASTIEVPARLAMRTGAAVVAVTSYRDPATGRRVLRVGEEVEMAGADECGGEEEAVLENTRRMSAALGEAIREHPEQWLWMHRRWKTQRVETRRAETQRSGTQEPETREPGSESPDAAAPESGPPE